MTTSIIATDLKQRRQVLTGTLVGTTIEFYDSLIYAQVAAIMLTPNLTEPALKANPQLAQVFARAILGISLLSRPLGAVIAGHIGDRYGRKMILVFTLIGIGTATFCIGPLPTYASIGVATPVLLVLLRILQDISAGGEWGGAVLMSVGYASKKKRGLCGASPQAGVPLGLTLATGIMLIVVSIVGEEAYMGRGWRVPFLLSFILVLVGYMIRRSVDESPVFQVTQVKVAKCSAPLPEFSHNHWGKVLQGALTFAAQQVTGYLVVAFFGAYAQKALGYPVTVAWTGTLVVGICWTIFMSLAGVRFDRIGRAKTFIIGHVLITIWEVVMWNLLGQGPFLYAMTVATLTLLLALTFDLQPAMCSEMFPAEIHYSSASIAYAIGAVLGGAFAPMIAQMIMDSIGNPFYISVYLIIMTVPALVALFLLPRGLEDRDLIEYPETMVTEVKACVQHPWQKGLSLISGT